MKRIKEKVKEALKIGYVRVYRSFEEWQWYSDIPCKVLYLHCILQANHVTKKWQKIAIGKGTFLTSVSKLSNDTGLTIQQVRTALQKLKSTNDITYKTTNKYTVIEVCNYCDWQNPETEINKENNMQNNKQITNAQQTNNKRITTTNNANNIIERENRENFEILIKYAELKGVKSPTAYASKVIKETSEENLKNVVESLQKEIKKLEEKMQKKAKMEAEKKEAIFGNQDIKPIEDYSDFEILEILQENSKKNAKGFKNPFVKLAEKEAKKRGLAI